MVPLVGRFCLKKKKKKRKQNIPPTQDTNNHIELTEQVNEAKKINSWMLENLVTNAEKLSLGYSVTSPVARLEGNSPFSSPRGERITVSAGLGASAGADSGRRVKTGKTKNATHMSPKRARTAL